MSEKTQIETVVMQLKIPKNVINFLELFEANIQKYLEGALLNGFARDLQWMLEDPETRLNNLITLAKKFGLHKIVELSDVDILAKEDC